jgi:hypothetical protein
MNCMNKPPIFSSHLGSIYFSHVLCEANHKANSFIKQSALEVVISRVMQSFLANEIFT